MPYFKGLWPTASLCALILGWAPIAQAVEVSLTSTTGDLSSLNVGDTGQFDVTLIGLTTEEITSLFVEVSYPTALLDTPTVTVGPIVPDPFDFLVEVSPAVDATYAPPFGLPVTSNGLFLSFESEVIDAGSDNLSFDFVGASDLLQDISITAGPDLPITVVSSGASVVSKPFTWALVVPAFLALAWLTLASSRSRVLRCR